MEFAIFEVPPEGLRLRGDLYGRLLYLTDTSRAVRVPTTEGYSVLRSPADPDRFPAALRAIGR